MRMRMKRRRRKMDGVALTTEERVKLLFAAPGTVRRK